MDPMAQQTSPNKSEVVPATQQVAQDNKWSNFETVFTNAKAGMAGVDKERVKRIVYEMSKVRRGMVGQLCHTCRPTSPPCHSLQDSPHFKNEQRKQAQTELRIKKLRAKAKGISPAELAASTK